MYILRSTRHQAIREAVLRHRRHLRRFGLVAVPAAFIAAIGISSLPAAAAPATLSSTTVNTLANPGGIIKIDPIACPPRAEGEDYSGNFTASYTVRAGISDGAYSGNTYIENGTVTVGSERADGRNAYRLTAYNATFRIDTNGGAVIRGTKAMLPDATPSDGICSDGFMSISVQNSYVATIDDGGTRFTDRGIAGTNLFGDNSNNPNNNYTVAFGSELDTPNNIGHAVGEGKYGNKTNFKFNVSNTKKGAKASCVVRDREIVPAIVVRCLDAYSYTRNNVGGGMILVKGNATVNGEPTTYELQILDNTPDGDIFGFSLGTGYTRSGVVTDGTIEVLR